MRRGKQIFKVLLLAVLLLGAVRAGKEELGGEQALAGEAGKKQYISIEKFAEKLEKAVDLEKGSLIKEGEFTEKGQTLIWTEAAVLTNRADELKNGAAYDVTLYKKVVDTKRLTGLKGLDEGEKRSARLCFIKGIILGSSKGKYSQSRAFHAADKVTVSEAHTILVRLKNKEKRGKLSPDGQLLRTEGLPKNYKSFDYILESFPNEFYERRFAYQMYQKELSQEKYASPKDIKEMVYGSGESFQQRYELYGDDWMETIRTNLQCRFNFDYRTVDKEWMSRLAGTYIYDNFETEWNKRVISCVKNYAETAKKNHVKLQADKIVVEPSTLYYSMGQYYVRCYIKFKLDADTLYPAKEGEENRQHEMIFSGYECVVLEGLKKNTWYEMSIDVPIRQTIGNQNPKTYSIGLDQIWPWK